MTHRVPMAALSLLAAVVLALPCASAAQEPAFTLDMAREAMDAAEAEARANDWDVAIVITDAEGVPIYVRRFDGVAARFYEIAMAKTATVAATGLNTAEYGERLEAGEVEEVPGGITFAGGVPVFRDGELIGTIGTSGVRAIEDEQISRAGADAIGG